MSKHSAKIQVLALAALLAFTGCGKDRTVDELQAQKENQEQNQTIQSVEGTFNGVLVSKINGQPMGSLSLEISSDTEITGTRNRNVIAANITLTTKDFSRTISASNGMYNIYSRAYQLDFTIADGQAASNGKSHDIQFRISGKYDPIKKALDGTIQSIEYANYGGKYHLTRDGNSPQMEDTRLPTERATVVLGKTYSATATINESRMRVKLRMSIPTRSPEQEFLDLFYPVRYMTVMASLTETKYDTEILTIPFENSEWNMDSKTLTGATAGAANGNMPYHYTLQCTEVGSAKSPAWKCVWSGSVVFNFTARAN